MRISTLHKIPAFFVDNNKNWEASLWRSLIVVFRDLEMST